MPLACFEAALKNGIWLAEWELNSFHDYVQIDERFVLGMKPMGYLQSVP